MHNIGKVAKTKSERTFALYTEEEIQSATTACTTAKNSASCKTEVNVSEVSSTSGEAQQPRASTQSNFMDLYDEDIVDILTVNRAFGAQKSGGKFPLAETNFKQHQIESKIGSKQGLSLVQEYVDTDNDNEHDTDDVVKETDKKIAPVVKRSSEKSAKGEKSRSVDDDDAVSELKNVSDQNVDQPVISSGKLPSKELSASIKTEESNKEASTEGKDMIVVRQNAAAKTGKGKEEGQISESDSSESLSSSDEKHSKKPKESKREKHRKKRTKEKKKMKKKRKKQRNHERSIESGSESKLAKLLCMWYRTLDFYLYGLTQGNVIVPCAFFFL